MGAPSYRNVETNKQTRATHLLQLATLVLRCSDRVTCHFLCAILISRSVSSAGAVAEIWLVGLGEEFRAVGRISRFFTWLPSFSFNPTPARSQTDLINRTSCLFTNFKPARKQLAKTGKTGDLAKICLDFAYHKPISKKPNTKCSECWSWWQV